MYLPNNVYCTGVRRTSLTVLGHLILNDMMKVKGNIARIALHLVDEEEEVRVCVKISRWVSVRHRDRAASR
jgi:condensin complex subunit 1